MKILNQLLLFGMLSGISSQLFGQKTIKKDTVYYLVDTASVPVKDRIFEIGVESHFYCYRLTCKCYPWQTDPVFTYTLNKKGEQLTNAQFNNLKLISLRELINIVSQYGIDRKDKITFYFIEPSEIRFIMHQVYLLDPKKPETLYDLKKE